LKDAVHFAVRKPVFYGKMLELEVVLLPPEWRMGDKEYPRQE
jgi:hypothetical protein